MKWKEKEKIKASGSVGTSGYAGRSGTNGNAGTSGRGLEERLSEYRHRMELVRTIIGFVLLCIQVWLFFHFSSK